MCERVLIAVFLALSLLSTSNTQAQEDYHEGESISDQPSSYLTVGEEEKEKIRLEALQAELEEQLKLNGGGEEGGQGAIPGEPEQDYPVYTTVPRTSFTCSDKQFPGYYADIEARCQAFHICETGGAKHSFLCPSGSLFNQKYLVCDWWYTSECEQSHHLFTNQRDIFKLYNEEVNQQNELVHQTGFVSNEAFATDEGDTNYISSQSDIFHIAETGVPNRESLENLRDTKVNHDRSKYEDKKRKLRDNNTKNSTYKYDVPTVSI